MFAEIRNRLTIRYTIVMFLFLMAFIVVSYSGMIWVLYREEQQDLRVITEEEAREHAALFRQKDGFFNPQPKEETEENNTDEKIFYYVFDTNGQQVAADEPLSEMRTAILTIIGKWNAKDGEARLKRILLGSGERAFVMMCSTKIYDGQRFLGTVYVGKDITSYYQMLKTLLIVLLLAAILFLLIAALAGHILAGRAIIPIKQAFSRQREFAADASHELRTPLSVLLTSVDAVQADNDNSISPFSSQVLDDMKDEIKRMSKLVSDLLTLARADAEVANIAKEKFELCTVTEHVVRSLQPLAAEKNIKLELNGANVGTISADRERINQLLLILVDNAIKYTPSGGMVVLLTSTVTDSEQGIRIIVKDSGVGISAEQRNMIFERFYRVDKARSREEGGTGLGLSIAKWIVEAHGGTISVESTPGVGSSFIVVLPK